MPWCWSQSTYDTSFLNPSSESLFALIQWLIVCKGWRCSYEMKHSQAFIITILLGTCPCMISVTLWDLNLDPSIQNISPKLEKTSWGWKELASRKQHQAKVGWGNAKTQRKRSVIPINQCSWQPMSFIIK
jgi:hypothetical protein